MDRDDNFSSAFRTVLEVAGVEPVRLPPKSPNLNAHLERFHLTRISHLTPCVLARNLRQSLKNKELLPNHAKMTGEPNG